MIIDNQTLNMKDSPYKDLAILTLMTFVLFALKAIWVVLLSSRPLIPDELLYKFNASAIFMLQKYTTAHYPPAYSLSLAPALFFKHWYEVMLVLNALYSSLVVPAAWLLARTAGVRKPLIAALLAGLLPMHAIYPHLLLSENLFVPLFVMAVALALRGGRRSHIEALVFGFVLGVAHLTKYLISADRRLDELRDRYHDDGSVRVKREDKISIFKLTKHSPDAGRIFCWKNRMSAAEQLSYERIAGKLLIDLGYETHFTECL